MLKLNLPAISLFPAGHLQEGEYNETLARLALFFLQGLLKCLLVWIVEAGLIGRVSKKWAFVLKFSREE